MEYIKDLFGLSVMYMPTYWFSVLVFFVIINLFCSYFIYKNIKLICVFKPTIKIPKALVQFIYIFLISVLIALPWQNLGVALGEYDKRSYSLVEFVNCIFGIPGRSKPLTKLLKKSGISEEMWNQRYKDRKLTEEENLHCNYIDGKATNSNWIMKNGLWSTGVLQSCPERNYYTFGESISPGLGGSASDKNISITINDEILKYPDLINILFKTLSKPCEYLPTLDMFQRWAQQNGIEDETLLPTNEPILKQISERILQQIRYNLGCDMDFLNQKKNIELVFRNDNLLKSVFSVIIERED